MVGEFEPICVHTGHKKGMIWHVGSCCVLFLKKLDCFSKVESEREALTGSVVPLGDVPPGGIRPLTLRP